MAELQVRDSPASPRSTREACASTGRSALHCAGAGWALKIRRASDRGQGIGEDWLFARAPTVDALRHWEERMEPPILTAEDETALARAKACCGDDGQCLVNHFIGLVQFSPSP